MIWPLACNVLWRADRRTALPCIGHPSSQCSWLTAPASTGVTEVSPMPFLAPESGQVLKATVPGLCCPEGLYSG